MDASRTHAFMENTKKQSKKELKKKKKTYFQIQFSWKEEVHLGKRQPFQSQFEHNTNAGGAKNIKQSSPSDFSWKKKGGGESEFARTDMQTPSQSTAWSASSERRI